MPCYEEISPKTAPPDLSKFSTAQPDYVRGVRVNSEDRKDDGDKPPLHQRAEHEARNLDLAVARTYDGKLLLTLTAGPETIKVVARPSVAASLIASLAKALAGLV